MARIKRNRPEAGQNTKPKRKSVSLRKKPVVENGFDPAEGQDVCSEWTIEVGLGGEHLVTVPESSASSLLDQFLRESLGAVSDRVAFQGFEFAPPPRMRDLYNLFQNRTGPRRPGAATELSVDFSSVERRALDSLRFPSALGRSSGAVPPEVSERVEGAPITELERPAAEEARQAVMQAALNIGINPEGFVEQMERINNTRPLRAEEFNSRMEELNAASEVVRAATTTFSAAVRAGNLGLAFRAGGFTREPILRPNEVPAVVTQPQEDHLSRIAQVTEQHITRFLDAYRPPDSVSVNRHGLYEEAMLELTYCIPHASMSRTMESVVGGLISVLARGRFASTVARAYAESVVPNRLSPANECELVLAGVGEPYFYLGCFPDVFLLFDLAGVQVYRGDLPRGVESSRPHALRARATRAVSDFLARRGM